MYLLTQIESLFFIVWGPSSECLFIASCFEGDGLVAMNILVNFLKLWLTLEFFQNVEYFENIIIYNSKV